MAKMFLKLNGIDGEAQQVDHQSWIEILAFNWSIHHPVSPNGVGPTPPIMNEMSLSKLVDKSSPQLVQNCAAGTRLGQATLEVVNYPPGKNVPGVVTLRIVMDPAVITSVDQSGSDQVSERFSMNFMKVQEVDYPMDGSGNPQTPTSGGWDLTMTQ